MTPTSIHYSKQGGELTTLLLQLFSVIGGLFMIAKVIDAYWTAAFSKPEQYSEVNPGSELF
jgi:hypothetical protein